MPEALLAVLKSKTFWKIVVLVLLVGGAFYKGYDLGSTIIQNRWDKAVNEALAQAAARSEKLEKDLSALRVKSGNLQRRLNDEISLNAQYSTCVLSPGSVRLYNDAWRGSSKSED